MKNKKVEVNELKVFGIVFPVLTLVGVIFDNIVLGAAAGIIGGAALNSILLKNKK